MKNNPTFLLLLTSLFTLASLSSAFAAPGTGNPGIPGQVLRNAADIADNFSMIQDNKSDIRDLDERVSDLEAGGSSGGERSLVEVDCDENPNALLVPPAHESSIYFPQNTTYNLHGACNGPLYVTEDGVRFVGVDGTDPAIVLPSGIPNAADGAVFADGTNDLRVQNLLIDASAWGTPAAQGSDAAGVYARNSFVRLIEVRIVGGLWGINPFRNALVRTQGLVEITGYVNNGISVGDQSVLSARGEVRLHSDVVGSDYLGAVDLYRNGLADFRRGLIIEPSANPEAYAIGVSQQSQVRIRNNGPIEIHGPIFISTLSSARIDGGNINGPIDSNQNSSLVLRNASYSGDLYANSGGLVNLQNVNYDDGSIHLESGSGLTLNNTWQNGGDISLYLNSTARVFNSSVGEAYVATGSVFAINESQLGGARFTQGAIGELYDVVSHGNIYMTGPASMDYISGDLLENTIFLCGTTDSNIDHFVAITGIVSDLCG